MNYFELFKLPVSLRVDSRGLKQKYFELSRQYHPDFFSGGSEEAQQQALEISSSINKALKIFTDRNETLKYTLTLKGVLEEEEKYSLPASFLMEMMEVNEQIAEAQMNNDIKAKSVLCQQIEIIEKNIYEPVQNIIENYQEGITAQKELLQVKDYYFRKKYLERLKKGLEGIS